MNILVYDVAAESGGAVSVLDYYYDIHKEDKDNHYYYLLGTYKKPQTENITVLNYPKVKIGWIYRLIFDYIKAPRIIKELKIDTVLSLQNTVIPRYKGYQTVYMHNILPFSEYRYSLFEDKLMWIYQNIIGRFIYSSMKKADHIIVQAGWIKTAIESRIPESKGKIEVQFPQVSISHEFHYIDGNYRKFFYPANFAPFKNHRVIVEAARLIKDKHIGDYEIIFTLNGNETQKVAELKQQCISENLPIKWVGYLSRNIVYKTYTESILLFPSYIETIGLPLYEAKKIGSPIVAANLAYAHEVLDDYEKKHYFDWKSAHQLSVIMMEMLEN